MNGAVDAIVEPSVPPPEDLSMAEREYRRGEKGVLESVVHRWGERGFESFSLQQSVCEPSVPLGFHDRDILAR